MKIDYHILSQYFTGESSEEEKDVIRLWLEENESHKKQFINARIRFDASLMIDEERMSSTRASSRKTSLYLLKIASVILILMGSSYLFGLYSNKQPEVIMQTIHVPTGNRISITLPDGSLVWLNSNTSFKYPNVFDGKQRIVELDGEAYFEIAKKREEAFIVKTNKYNVEVLGTTFNVEAYSDKPVFSTALFTGKVKLYKEQGEGEVLFLNQGETVELVDNKLNVYSTESEIYRWQDGLIVIENKSFEEIMQLFEKYFGYAIIVQNDKVKDLGYRGKLRISDGIDHALRVLQNDFRFTYKRDEEMNRIYIY